MVTETEPKVYLIGTTQLEANPDEGNDLFAYLQDIGGPNWYPDHGLSDGETILEVAGRMCYRSWQPWDEDKPLCSNMNVSKVREGNRSYLKNILETKHGSVLEHVYMTMILRDVSRVFTHELVRHRAGMAFSQESLRYVALNNLRFRFPDCLSNHNPSNSKAVKAYNIVIQALSYMEQAQNELRKVYKEELEGKFEIKKFLTSAFRRVAPIGLSTSIMVTGNLRAWRHILTMRSSPAAEEEAQLVSKEIGRLCLKTYPNAFQDLSFNNDTNCWELEHIKV